MDVNEFVRFADELIFDSTGKHLDNQQQAILRGTWQRKKYSEIAQESHCSEGYLKDVGAQLWRTLSKMLGEQVKKSNFRSTMERLLVSNVNNSKNFVDRVNFVQIGNVNVCQETSQPSQVPTSPQTQLKDMGDAPDVTCFYGRRTELSLLKKWIVDEKSPLVSILGIKGVGKTALAVRLVEEVKDYFDCIFWRSLQFCPPAKVIQTELLKFLAGKPSRDSQVMLDEENQVDLSIYQTKIRLDRYLKKSSCLIILDDVEAIFTRGELAGNYKPEHQEYSSIFQAISQINSNTTLLLISSEKPRELTRLSNCLKLGGLGEAAREIIREEGLSDEGWETLLNNYGGNPFWLKSISTTIANLFKSSIENFLQYSPILLNDELKEVLRKDIQRLSAIELEVISHISSKEEPVSLSRLLQEMSLSAGDLLTAMESLERRSLLEEPLLEDSQEKQFTIQPLIKEYFINCSLL